MKLARRRRKTTPEMNMTPMIDVVFLLLIFFMTVTQASQVNKEAVELPELEGWEEQKPTTVMINVDEEGRYIVTGEERTSTELLELVARELTRLNDNPALLTVVIRADRRAKCGAINSLVTSLSKLQVRKVRFAVKVPQE